VPELVTIDVWGVPGRSVPSAITRMATDRGPLRRIPGLRFAKLMGTGSGRTFTFRDTDLRHWAVLCTWGSAAAAANLRASRTFAGWERLAEEHWRADLAPIASRGRWSRQEPFGAGATSRPTRAPAGQVAAITRARLVPRRAATFWRAVPPVSADLNLAVGLRFALGIGEAPVGLQGTFSVWDSTEALRRFAYERPAHLKAVAETARLGWYAEELFARFRVLSTTGCYCGRDPLG
jgi:hypothetical protein